MTIKEGLANELKHVLEDHNTNLWETLHNLHSSEKWTLQDGAIQCYLKMCPPNSS